MCDPHPLVAERVHERLRREPEDVVITRSVDELITVGLDACFVTSPDDTPA